MLARAASCLDHNAGSPLSARAQAAILSLLNGGGRDHSDGPAPAPFFLGANPSSAHAFGRQARKLLNEARERVAASLGGVAPREIVFTSSGTEASQQAIRAALAQPPRSGRRASWVLGAGEHEATYRMAAWFEAQGGESRYLPLRADGSPALDQLAELIDESTLLVSHTWANNETGVVTDVARLAAVVRGRGAARLHLDGAQAWGKLPIALGPELADYVSFSGHKVGGLAGSGALWVSPRVPAGPGLTLGAQEGERRGGTENLLAAVALGAAASELDPVDWAARLAPVREAIERTVMRAVAGTRIHGAGVPRLANTVNFGFEGVERAGLVEALDQAGFAVSAGAACSSGMPQPSRVLRAMGRTEAQARAGVRVSIGTPPGDAGTLGASDAWIAEFAAALAGAVGKMRERK